MKDYDHILKRTPGRHCPKEVFPNKQVAGMTRYLAPSIATQPVPLVNVEKGFSVPKFHRCMVLLLVHGQHALVSRTVYVRLHSTAALCEK